MRSAAETIASNLATTRDLARAQADKSAAAAAAASAQFATILADNAVAQTSNAPSDAATVRHSAAWEDFFSRPVIGTSEDGLPIVGETEEELALTRANATRYAASHGQDSDNPSCIQTRLPVHDGVMGTKIGYRLATAVQLTGMTPIVDSDLTG